MEGIGALSTSSPRSPITGRPRSSKASTFAPRQRQAISPACTGTSGEPATKAVQTSVPPDADTSSRSRPTCS
jgi:hypothetical protein